MPQAKRTHKTIAAHDAIMMWLHNEMESVILDYSRDFTPDEKTVNNMRLDADKIVASAFQR